MSDAAIAVVPGLDPVSASGRVGVQPPPGGTRPEVDALLPFARLDRLLAVAVAEAPERFGADSARDAFRGLYVTEQQAQSLLSRRVGEPFGGGGTHAPYDVGLDWAAVVARHPGWRWLRETGLSDRELDVVLIALGPEADLRYERLYGYLQDDVSRRRPTVSLVLDLVSSSAEERLGNRSLFGAQGSLVARDVIRLVPEEQAVAPPLLSHAVVPDEQVTARLLLQPDVDRSLAESCRLTTPPAGAWSEVPLPPHLRAAVLGAATAAARDGRRLCLHLQGPVGSGRLATAEALAGELHRPSLTLTAVRLPDVDAEAARALSRAFREATVRDAVLVVHGVDDLPAASRRREALVTALATHPGVVVLTGAEPWAEVGAVPLGVLVATMGRWDLATRRVAWERCLDAAGAGWPADLAASLAGAFSFGPPRIAEAVSSAVTAARPGRPPRTSEVFAAARRQTSQRLATLATRITPTRSWDGLVLPEATTARLTELCARVRLRSIVLDDWGFGSLVVRGAGTTALFTGPPGTGKTTAAEVVAGELGLDLFAIDLSTVVSKYIGETEKNLERIFAAAEEADAILLFDEADALFGKRSEVRDAHDRYANIETSYLLQRMEQYDGVAILATNFRENLDEAFTRRLQFVVDFPFPDQHQREGIWAISFPPDAPLADDVVLSALAARYRLSGAAITNAVLHAAYLAAAQQRPICAAMLDEAVRHELRKMGRVPPDPEPIGPDPLDGGG